MKIKFTPLNESMIDWSIIPEKFLSVTQNENGYCTMHTTRTPHQTTYSTGVGRWSYWDSYSAHESLSRSCRNLYPYWEDTLRRTFLGTWQCMNYDSGDWYEYEYKPQMIDGGPPFGKRWFHSGQGWARPLPCVVLDWIERIFVRPE